MGKQEPVPAVIILDIANRAQLTALSAQLYAIRDSRKKLEEEEAICRKSLAALVDPLTTQHGNKLQCDTWVITKRETVSKRIDADMLLTRGVAPDVIRDCTKESRSYAYMVELAK